MLFKFLNIKFYFEIEKKTKKVIERFYSNDIHIDKSICVYNKN